MLHVGSFVSTFTVLLGRICSYKMYLAHYKRYGCGTKTPARAKGERTRRRRALCAVATREPKRAPRRPFPNEAARRLPFRGSVGRPAREPDRPRSPYCKPVRAKRKDYCTIDMNRRLTMGGRKMLLHLLSTHNPSQQNVNIAIECPTFLLLFCCCCIIISNKYKE